MGFGSRLITDLSTKITNCRKNLLKVYNLLLPRLRLKRHQKSPSMPKSLKDTKIHNYHEKSPIFTKSYLMFVYFQAISGCQTQLRLLRRVRGDGVGARQSTQRYGKSQEVTKSRRESQKVACTLILLLLLFHSARPFFESTPTSLKEGVRQFYKSRPNFTLPECAPTSLRMRLLL